MASLNGRASQAAELHRQAAAAAAAAAATLDSFRPTPADQGEQRDLAERLRAAAAGLAPGWLAASLDAGWTNTPLGGGHLPRFVRIGTAAPLEDAWFPAIVPLIGTGHLSISSDTRDPQVAGVLKSVLLRLLAAAPPGSLLLRAVDGAGAGTVFAPFAPLADAGLMAPPVTHRAGMRAVIAEAERWVRPARRAAGRNGRRDSALLVVIASLPESAENTDLDRLAALAEHGPDAGLHLIVAGWPPPVSTPEPTRPPLPRTTGIALHDSFALVGDPPDGLFGDPANPPSAGLTCPVLLDDSPPKHVLERVSEELAAGFAASSRRTLRDLIPDELDGLWTENSASGLATTVGHDGDRPVTLQFNDLAGHWLIGGRSGAGKTAFLVNVLYGLCTRYGPPELTLYLIDFAEGASFTEFAPTDRDGSWLPHARAIGVESDRDYGLAVLRELDAEMARRSVAYKRAGVARFADLRAHHPLPRVVCVLNEFPMLLDGGGRTASEAITLLESVARRGRSYGIHLILASRTMFGVDALVGKRDSILGQFPVRVALPGGGEVLDPSNDAAAGLPLGTAVVNTAGGLGGPRGAIRGHERIVRFPDPHGDRAALNALRQRLWEACPPDASAPRVFAGYAAQHLAADPVYRSVVDRCSARPAALLGRSVDLAQSTAAFPFDTSPGRHLAIFGTSSVGADILDAATRSLASHHGPRTAHFVIASLVADGDEVAEALAADVAQRQEVETVDAPGLAKALAVERPTYLVIFGMDAVNPGTLPTDGLRTLLREGPGRGVHLLSWWRTLRRFTEEVGGSGAREDLAGMLFLDVPASEVAPLIDEQMDWDPRPNRALLHDRHAGRTTVIVPFVRAAGAR